MRAHLYRPITDSLGNIRQGAVVRVLEPGTDTLIPDTLYVGEVGLTALPNPFTTSSGVIDFYLDTPRRIRLGVKVGSESERFAEAVDVLAPEHEHGEFALVDHAHPAHTHPYAADDHTHSTVAAHLHGPDGFTPIFFSDDGPVTVHVGALPAYNDSGRDLEIISVRASLAVAGTTPTVVDLNQNGVTRFSNQAGRPQLAQGVTTTSAPPELTLWEMGTYLTCDVDEAGTGAEGLLVQVTVR